MAWQLDDGVLLAMVPRQSLPENLVEGRLVVQDELGVCGGGDGREAARSAERPAGRGDHGTAGAPLTTSLISPGGAWRTSFETRATRSA
jgi:hypothetical protein